MPTSLAGYFLGLHSDPPKRRWASSGLHCTTSLKTELFILIASREQICCFWTVANHLSEWKHYTNIMLGSALCLYCIWNKRCFGSFAVFPAIIHVGHCSLYCIWNKRRFGSCAVFLAIIHVGHCSLSVLYLKQTTFRQFCGISCHYTEKLIKN
jgi:hypothetical protein